MVHHHAVTYCKLSNAGPDLGDHPARLMPGDLQIRRVPAFGFGRPVVPQIAPAQAGGFHLDNHVAGPGVRIRQRADFDFLVSRENYATHL
jgi:hypothetical protein